MVQEYVSPVRVHKYPFEMVMAAYERRFPNCPQIPVVIECVITEDSWTADDSQRHTSRRCQLNVDAPYLLKKMIGVDYIYFLQKNHLDLKTRVLEIEATNESFASRVEVIEKCKYYVHPENSEWTCFEQSALLDVKNFFGLESTVEKIAMKQYASNIAKGKELIESFMSEVFADNIKDLRPWDQQDPCHNRYLRKIVSRGTEPLSPRALPETRKHSQPGTSSQLSNEPKCSSPRMSSSSKDLRLLSTSANHIMLTPGSKRNIHEGSSFKSHSNQKMKSESLQIAMSGVRHRIPDDDRRGNRVFLKRGPIDSEENINIIEQSLRPRVGDSRSQSNFTRVSTRRNNILMILSWLVLVFLLILAIPMAYYFH